MGCVLYVYKSEAVYVGWDGVHVAVYVWEATLVRHLSY